MSNEVEVVKVKKVAGNDLIVSDAAQNHLIKQLKKNSDAIGVRLSLSKTGCSGLSYVFDFITEEVAQDRKFKFDNLVVYIDNKSFPYLKGLKIDFVKEGLNHKYLYDNPNQTGQCGCGESFTIDE